MTDELSRHDIRIDGTHVPRHTFLLGNRGGFVLYLPACRNVSDETAQAIKWFGASSFGRSYFEGFQIWAECDGHRVALNRTNQTSFDMALDGAARVYNVQGHEIREAYLVPDGPQGFVLTVESDLPVIIKPEWDMRFYQSFDTDFTAYRAEQHERGLMVSNCLSDVGPAHETLEFYAAVGRVDGALTIDLVPEDERLVRKTYLKDERREKMIEHVYREAQASFPDEAPIWDQYSTCVFAPALLRLTGSTQLIFSFGDTADDAWGDFRRLHANVSGLRDEKRRTVAALLDSALLQTGKDDVDSAYAHVLTRFNDALVARDATVHVAPMHREHYYAIFAGDKYFMDAWKRDENISLGALLVTGDFATAREILANTWQFQDERTGRLPHIIRAGEPLVYYSSDGTLWALQRLFEYTKRSGDLSLLQDKMPMVEHFFEASMHAVARGLLPSGGIIDKTYLWETWEDTPYTPRDGYPVEIELLWLTVLSCFLPLVRPSNGGLADSMDAALREGTETFRLFEHDGYLVDSLSYDWQQRRILTPNGYIAFGLGYPLPDVLARSMVALARDQLAGHRGVRSLAPRDWPLVLPAAFLADPRNVRGKDMRSVGIFNYHRGIEWEWLNSFFVAAELGWGDADSAFRAYVEGQVREARTEVGIGGLSELHDREGQVGADFQAWSMAGFIESLHCFTGIGVDTWRKQVSVAPSLPKAWPCVRSRSRVGDTGFIVEYAHLTAGTRRLEIALFDAPPAGYELCIRLPLLPGERMRGARRDGVAVPLEVWTFQNHPSLEGGTWAHLTVPLEQRLVLEVELEHQAG